MVIDWSLSIHLTSHILDTRLHRRRDKAFHSSTNCRRETRALFRIAAIGGGSLSAI